MPYILRWRFGSQSPLVGAFVPAEEKLMKAMNADKSQSPLVGAFVPAKHLTKESAMSVFVAIPSGRGIRSGV